MTIESLLATRARCLVQLNSFCIRSATRIPISFPELPGACHSRGYLRHAANGPPDSVRYLQTTWHAAREFNMAPQPQHPMETSQFNQWLAGQQ